MKNWNTYAKLKETLENLEKTNNKFIYLPNFECCGTCASAELNGFMGSPRNPKFDPYDFYVTFNEQTGENASFSNMLVFYSGVLNDSLSEEDATLLIKESLLSAGFKETNQVVYSKLDITDEIWNSFAVSEGIFYLYGNFLDLEPDYDEDYDDEE